MNKPEINQPFAELADEDGDDDDDDDEEEEEIKWAFPSSSKRIIIVMWKFNWNICRSVTHGHGHWMSGRSTCPQKKESDKDELARWKRSAGSVKYSIQARGCENERDGARERARPREIPTFYSIIIIIILVRASH